MLMMMMFMLMGILIFSFIQVCGSVDASVQRVSFKMFAGSGVLLVMLVVLLTVMETLT